MIPSKEEWERVLAGRHTEGYRQKFSAARVAVCGLGGLGSCVAIALARAGIGRLVLIDDDSVELSNLHRQQYRVSQIGMKKTDALAEILAEIAPYTAIERHTVRLREENISKNLAGCDVICEALDRAEEKAMLVRCVRRELSEAYLVAASGMAGFGSPNAIRTERVGSRFYLCGDGESDVSRYGTLVSARVMLCAAHQAQTILRILAGETE